VAVSKEKYEFRILNGLCTRCGEPVVSGKKSCQYHLDEAALKEKLKRERRINKNLCMKCGQRPPRDNKIDCEECFQENKKYYPLKTKLYSKRKESSLCIRCGTKTEDNVHCEECRVYMKSKDKLTYYKYKTNNLCVSCGNKKDIDVVLCSECQIINSNRGKQINKNQKKLIFDHYGNKCGCCGESNLIFLELDHINGGGHQHRIKLRKQGVTMYRWIIKNNFPEGFQTLCSNCNRGRYKNGGICPHQQKLTEEVRTIGVGLPTQEEK